MTLQSLQFFFRLGHRRRSVPLETETYSVTSDVGTQTAVAEEFAPPRSTTVIETRKVLRGYRFRSHNGSRALFHTSGLDSMPVNYTTRSASVKAGNRKRYAIPPEFHSFVFRAMGCFGAYHACTRSGLAEQTGYCRCAVSGNMMSNSFVLHFGALDPIMKLKLAIRRNGTGPNWRDQIENAVQRRRHRRHTSHKVE